MKTINSRPNQMAHLSQHGHNLSFDFAFTSPVGYLLPVMYDFLNVGEKVDIDLGLGTITNPLLKPALTRIDEHIDVFFVPLRKLSTIAPEIMENVDDLTTSAITSSTARAMNGDLVPTFDLTKVVEDFVQNKSVTYDKPVNYLKPQLSNLLASCRLLEHLGYNPDIFDGVSEQWGNADDYQPSINPLNLLAYQAIYYDYYRLSSFEQNVVSAYNIDFGYNHPVLAQDVGKFAELHCRPYRRDYFKNIEPSPLQSSLGVLLDNTALGSLSFSDIYLPKSATSPNSYGYRTSDPTGSVTVNDGTNVRTIPPGGSTATALGYYMDNLNTANIRQMFAFEKYLRVTQRSGKHTDDQIAAHYGVKVPRTLSNEVMHIGSFHSVIDFQAVVSTADTQTEALGALAGRGYSKGGKSSHIKFKAPCHGIIMALYSSEPSLMYHTGIDKLNLMYNLFDYPKPEFDHLGMQPLFGYEFRAVQGYAATRYGWQFRYAQFKQKYDRATYAFTSNIHGYYDPSDLSMPTYGIGPYQAYAITEQNLQSNNIGWYNTLYVKPTDTDQIFLVGFDPLAGFPWTLTFSGNDELYSYVRAQLSNQYATDPFIHKFSCRYFKTSWMSVFGEPEL